VSQVKYDGPDVDDDDDDNANVISWFVGWFSSFLKNRRHHLLILADHKVLPLRDARTLFF
jgi:hypothetical protein